MTKNYFYKAYDVNGLYLGTLNKKLIESTPSFTWAVNGGQGSMDIDFAIKVDEAGDLLTGSIDPGGDLTYWDNFNWDEGHWDQEPGTSTTVYYVDVYCNDGDEQAKKIFSGIRKRSNQKVQANGDQQVSWTLYSWITQLTRVALEDASGNTTITYNSFDPADIFTDIIDKLNAKFPSPVFTYDSSSIEATGLTVSYTFKYVMGKEALDKTLELCPDQYIYYLDADNKFHLKKATATADETVLTLGQQFNEYESSIDESNVVNTVFFKGGDTGGGTDLYKKYTDSDSISTYGINEVQVQDSRVTIANTAQTKANRILRELSEPPKEVRINVFDNNAYLGDIRGYDGESFKPGDSIVLRHPKLDPTVTTWDNFNWDEANWDADAEQIFGRPFKLISIDYSPYNFGLTLAEKVPSFEKRQEDIERNLRDEQSINVPNQPS